MKHILITGLTIALLILYPPYVSLSQTKAKLVLPESTVYIKGTSSVHDWEVVVEKFEAGFLISNKDTKSISINDIKAVFSGASITSGNKIMNGKTYDALRVKEHPDIVFTSDGMNNIIEKDGEFSGTIDGKLFIGGISRAISVSFSGKISENKILIKGLEDIKMSEFDIRPPTALLGTLKTGEKVTVGFTLSFLIPSASIVYN